MNRRGFLSALARTPVVGALAGKMLADDAMAKLAGVQLSGMTSGAAPLAVGNGPSGPDPTPKDWARGLRDAATRRRVEAMIYELERAVYQLDPDLVAKQSFSLNAKIVFQRQRNVARRLAELQQDYHYRRLSNVLNDFLGFRLPL